jgi:all-trans-retinol 13,14-reductase
MYDYIVIGSGVSGVTSAIILAQFGHRVAVVEKASRITPVLRGFSRNGLYFDTGFHYTGSLGHGELLQILMRYLGIMDKVEPLPYPEEKSDIFICRETGFRFEFPYGFQKIREKLSEQFPGESAAIATYTGDVESTFQMVTSYSLGLSEGPASLLEEVHGPTLQQYLDGLTKNDLLKTVLSMHYLLYGVYPGDVLFSHHARIMGSYYQSAYGIRGGGRSLVDASTSRLAALNVDLYCGRGAAEIVLSPAGAIRGVRLSDGELIEGNGCISTVHPKAFCRLFKEPPFRPAYINRIKNLEETLSAYILYGAYDADQDFSQGSNMFLFPRTNMYADEKLPPVGQRPLFIAPARQEGNAKGRAGFTAICPADFHEVAPWDGSVRRRRPAAYYTHKTAAMEAIERRIVDQHPDLARSFSRVESATPLTLKDYCNAPGGGLYGTQHRQGQIGLHPKTKIDNLFIAGQSITAPGYLGAMLSAFITCGLITGRDRLKEGLERCR